MPRSAARLDGRIHALVDRLDNPRLPIAEVARRVCAHAESIGLTRPSYEAVRVAVHRRRERGRYPGVGEVLLDIAFRARPPDAFLDAVTGDLPPKRK